MISKKLDKESIFESMDVFSKHFEFTFGGKDKFKSYIVGYFTFFTLFVVIYLIWLLGKEILYRNVLLDIICFNNKYYVDKIIIYNS
jgi:hypothetical protein